jgi:DNA polymerase-1
VDLSQVDARAVAVHSQDHNYIAMFAPGKDLHRWVAERLWGDPSRRQDAKVLAHGWAYNMGIPALARHTGLSMSEASDYDKFLRESFPRLVDWKQEMVDRGGNGETLDNGFGRKMRVDPRRAWTQAPALMGQGCARDMLMHGLLRLDPALHEYLRMVVHDEVVLSVPAQSAEAIGREVQEALSFEWAPPGASIPIQVLCDLSVGGRTWASAYKD